MKADKKAKTEYFLDSVGRRRKLSHGAMIRICNRYAQGTSTTDLANEYGVSTSLIRTVTYHTAREVDRGYITPPVEELPEIEYFDGLRSYVES